MKSTQKKKPTKSQKVTSGAKSAESPESSAKLPSKVKNPSLGLASSKSPSPKDLGRKRFCPSCKGKFYDFGKEAVDCPKCGLHMNKYEPPPRPTLVAPKPTPKPTVIEDGDEPSTESAFETLDDLEDEDEETVVDGMPSDKDSDEDY